MRRRKHFDIFGKKISVKNVQRTSVNNVYAVKTDDGIMIYLIGFDSLYEEMSVVPAAMIERGDSYIAVAVPPSCYGGSLCFECNIVHALGELYLPGDYLFPEFELTGGAVMFTVKDGKRKYLIIKNESGHIGFPKGHVEYGETIEQTAAREVLEETGLSLDIFGSFRHEYTYTTKEGCIKTGVFFISEYVYRAPEIQREEILDDWLLSYDEAISKLNFPEDRELLEKADKYINEHSK